MSYKEKLGGVVKDIRMKMGLSPEELANRCGLTEDYIVDFEDKKKGMSFDHLIIVGQVLGVPACFLCVLAEDDVPDIFSHFAGLYSQTKEGILKYIESTQPIAMYQRSENVEEKRI